MTMIQGTIKREGIAIAIAARVDSVSGINGVDPAILEQGIRSIRKGLIKQDYPEVVVVCDNVVMGASIRIPGISTIGIAAQEGADAPGVELDVPCVIGLPNLLQHINRGSLIIVDGCQGLVHVDPDPHTLLQYQRIEEDRSTASQLLIASEHVPARTQAGDVVYIYAYVTDNNQVEQALEQGADGLLVDLRNSACDTEDFYRSLMRAAPGMPIVFIIDFGCVALIEAASAYAAPGQVTVALPPAVFDELLFQFDGSIRAGQIGVGCMVGGNETYQCPLSIHRLVVDLRKSSVLQERDAGDLAFRLAGWIAEREPETALVLLGKELDALADLVRAGAKSLVVSPNVVEEAKLKVRRIGFEDTA